MDTSRKYRLRVTFKDVPKGTIFTYDPECTWNHEHVVWRGNDKNHVCFPYDYIKSHWFVFAKISFIKFNFKLCRAL